MSATKSFALRSTILRTVCHRPIRPPLRFSIGRRGYAARTPSGLAKDGDMPWLITAVAITIPCAAYLLYKRPAKKTHEEDKHSVKAEKPKEEIPPKSTSPTPKTQLNTEDEDSKGETNAESKDEASKDDESSNEEQPKKEDGKSTDDGDSSDSSSDGERDATPDSSDEGSKKTDDSHESRVDPTKK